MKNTMPLGIILTILGSLIAILGIVLLTKNSDRVVNTNGNRQKKNEATNTDKQKGDNFEKYIVQKFSKSYFSIVEWTGDKYVDGRYAKSNTNPDLRLRFKMKNIESDFSVECKYRSNYYKNGVEWCSEQQLQNYKNYANNNGISVFVAIGIGGAATAPEELFIIPLAEMKNIFVNQSFLNKYKKEKVKDNNLFYDYQTGRLK